MKHCWGCHEDLPREAFHNDKGKKDGLQSKCKRCQYARYRERLAEDPGKVREVANASQRRHRRMRMYGITNERYSDMVAERQGRCDACGRVPDKLVVDHCHDTGAFRGLLCHHCNRGFGFLGDTAAEVRKRLAYLELTRD